MVVLTAENILSKGSGFSVNTLCLCQAYTKQPTKNGGSFYGGTLSFRDGAVSFKAWGNSKAYEVLSASNLSGKIVEIVGEVNVYQGNKSLIVSVLKEVPEETLASIPLSASDFLYSKYNTDLWFNSYVDLLKKNLSENAYMVFSEIMDGDIKSRFREEFGALFYHDSCKSGLLAHSFKVTRMAALLKNYPSILKRVSVDLLYFGCALHDIGKIREYSNGSISSEGKSISHNISGILILNQYKDRIVDVLGEDFYINLCSIISGHHGEAGEPPRTVAAYVVHILDYTESRLAGLDDILSKSEDEQVVFEGFKLS